MKIGILTFHSAVNYGGVLQAYALQEEIKKIGGVPEIVDYKTPYFAKRYSPVYIPSFSLKKIAYALLDMPNVISKNRKFKRFSNKFLKLSERAYDRITIKSACGDYQKFIVGSDQVWNLQLTDNDTTYLLDFCDDNSKKYSYAASFGSSRLDSGAISVFQDKLLGFQAVSVREESAKHNADAMLSGKEARVDIDPTMFLSSGEWEKCCVAPNINEKYIVVYKLNQSQAFDCAKKLSEATGLKVVVLQAQLKGVPYGFICKRKPSPEEFLGWIKHSEYVVTDSFHGTAFSIIFHKKFMTLPDKRPDNRNTRIENLLKLASLENRMGNGDSCELIHNEIDYKNTDARIRAVRAGSERYLKSILEL